MDKGMIEEQVIDLLADICDDDAVRAAIETALRTKPDAHHTNDGTERFMSQIGG